LLCWSIVGLLTATFTATSCLQALDRYETLQTGWSWDLAYYNQWFWALTQGDGQLSVRPLAAYAEEGPSVWKMNYVAPVRLVIAPFYWAFPDPRTLLVVQCVVFWWLIPAAYSLVWSETGSDAVALSAALLVPLTPLLGPLVENDFRELQLALPFVLWAVQGVRSRQTGLAALGILGMLCCRQEFGVMVATFAFLPPREPEDLGRSLRWRDSLFSLGLAWVLFGFFGYLFVFVGHAAPDRFMDQFFGPKAPIDQTLKTATIILGLGLGSWSVLAGFSPRVAVLALPWIWELCGGRWALRYLGTEEWHHVRYAAPAVAMVLAAGLVGYASLARRLQRWGNRGAVALGLVWLACVVGFAPGLVEVARLRRAVPRPIGAEEAQVIQGWFQQVRADDAVLAAYELTAPLSSRRKLFSYRLEPNKPPGFPSLDSSFRWVFLKSGELSPKLFTEQGFEVVHEGPFATILRR
jgi:hypothetical protein